MSIICPFNPFLAHFCPRIPLVVSSLPSNSITLSICPPSPCPCTSPLACLSEMRLIKVTLKDINNCHGEKDNWCHPSLALSQWWLPSPSREALGYLVAIFPAPCVPVAAFPLPSHVAWPIHHLGPCWGIPPLVCLPEAGLVKFVKVRF